jgi:hypothetical protein
MNVGQQHRNRKLPLTPTSVFLLRRIERAMTQNGVLKDRKWVLKISHDKYKPCEHRYTVGYVDINPRKLIPTFC